MVTNQLSFKDSYALKGFALALLLIHHLFGITSTHGWYDDIVIGNHEIINEIGKSSKLCVAIFVFLSGYGLTRQTEQKEGIHSLATFYKHRLLKLFIHYWFIWLIFVPIGVFVFGRTLEESYNEWWVLKSIIDFVGLAFFVGFFGYNATWWFMSCIIILYLLYPVLYKMTKSHRDLTLIGCIAITLLPVPLMQYEIIRYALPFILGIRLAIQGLPKNGGGNFVFLSWMTVCLLLFAERSLTNIPIFVDSLLCISLSITYLMFPKIKIIDKILVFIGKHSMNIFLFHTFIFSHWFKEIIYSPRNPVLVFLFLLVVCLLISLLLEKIKKILFVDRLLKII